MAGLEILIDVAKAVGLLGVGGVLSAWFKSKRSMTADLFEDLMQRVDQIENREAACQAENRVLSTANRVLSMEIGGLQQQVKSLKAEARRLRRRVSNMESRRTKVDGPQMEPHAWPVNESKEIED